MGSTTFSAASAVTCDGAGGHRASLDPAWTIDGRPNGGYLLATLARAALAGGAHEHVVSASAVYLRAPDPGPVTVSARTLRAGRSASQLSAELSQGEAPCVRALLIAGALEPADAPDFTSPLALAPEMVPLAECVALPDRPDGTRPAIMDEVEIRLTPDSLGWARGTPSGRGELRGWLTLPGGEPPDPLSLLYAVDAFPPASFDVRYTGWVPTLELTVAVRALPAPGPLWIRQRVGTIAGGRFDETCHVWDRAGHLVAHATQLAGIRW